MSAREITKSARSKIRVAVEHREGKTAVDVRTYKLDGRREFVPTIKGVAVPVELLDELIGALIDLRNEAYRTGLLSRREGT